jgi:16S rRNA (guanine966-N2)-methyltransferase
VISGSARGRAILAPAGHKVRPTSQKTRQAMFNALGSRNFIADATVIDLFAGTGALGIEALSRGAARAIFVEHERIAVDCLTHNLNHLQFADRADVVRSDVIRWLETTGPRPFAVDEDAPLLVIADPPYTFTGWADLLSLLHPRLAPLGVDAIAVLESGRTIELPENWELEREQRYGSAYVTFARPAGASDESESEDSESD